jgi:hypothetical protein
MRWFGKSWGAPVCTPESEAPRPSAPCAHCGGAIGEHDSGVILPFAGGPGDPPELPYHRLCLLDALGLGRGGE